MQIRFGVLNKHASWSSEQFRNYWRDQHASLARQLPGLLSYHQNHVVDALQRGISHKRGPEVVDGLSQLAFDDSAAMSGAFSPELARRLVEDENHFIDRLRILVAQPHTVVEPPKPGVGIKRMSFLRRREDVTPEKFAHEWQAVHGPLVRELPGLRGYRQNLVVGRESPKGVPVEWDGWPIDGVVELWFDDVQSLDAAFASPQGVKTMQHATTFIDEITTFLVEPFVVI